ncbi:SURF1 family protein [Homoserinibacter sp. GY 40078]|uniref:SURF1 family protein n=1 Tax=Homoserinibacter sp. GY 40078 TaxID=2603275 RepID=UPI0011C73F78|nr:SURF1 family protein [Homoserinibacter sp. GY 40078]TXK19223.1 SURF1 family protein [Homoserinibacter sp. GY 40078]
MPDTSVRPPRPTLRQFAQVARRPRWIGALVLALAIAAAFSALGQWQLERSVENVTVEEPETETPVPLAQVATPQAPMTDASIGQRVTLAGRFTDEFLVLTGRDNDGTEGAWLVGHLVTDDGASLAVGIGWAPDAAAAAAAESAVPTDQTIDIAGRYLPSESPEVDDVEAGEQRALSIGALVNLWTDPGPTYAGYLVLEEPTPGLDAIHQPPPLRDTSLNWLNLFYAIEWVIFAGFAVYLWYRVVRDVWEREEEERRAADAPAGP